jgi:hypothetical protein
MEPNRSNDVVPAAMKACTIIEHPHKETIMRTSVQFLVAGFIAVGLVSATAGSASAQPKDKKEATGKVKTYDFSGDTIEGDLIKPEGSNVDVRDFGKHSSLIRIRKDFIPEIIKSAEDL